MDELLQFETPEQIEISYDIARLGSRFIAALWDTLAIVMLQLMLFLAGAVILDVIGTEELFASNWAIAALFLLSFVLFWGYYVIFESIWNGQTPGKRLAGIRTVRSDGYPIGFVESAIRNLVRIADFLPGNYGIGTIVMFVDKRSRRLGDFAAGTIVVHDRPAAELTALRANPVQDDRFLEPVLPNIDRLTFDEVEAARRFLQRRSTLINADALARQLGDRFRERIASGTDLHLSDTELLQRIVAQYRR